VSGAFSPKKAQKTGGLLPKIADLVELVAGLEPATC